MKSQKGESLISLLIGLLISMIVITGMLMVFRSTLRITVPATTAAISDGERIAALMRAHMMLQGAGFGIESPQYGIHLVVEDNLVWINVDGGGYLETTTGGGGSNGNSQGNGNANSNGNGNDLNTDTPTAIIWADDLDQDGVLQCEGLVPTNEGGLKAISAVCNDAGHWGDVQTWDATDITGEINFTVAIDQSSTCQPFGVPVAGALTVILTTTTSSGHPVSSTTCLANFQ